MPVTFLTFAIGYLAIIGVPAASPASGPRTRSSRRRSATTCVVGLAALVGAGVTAFYMTRLMLMTFFGKKRWAEDVHPHESPKVMTVPADRARRAVRARWPAAARRLDRRLAGAGRRRGGRTTSCRSPRCVLTLIVAGRRRGRRRDRLAHRRPRRGAAHRARPRSRSSPAPPAPTSTATRSTRRLFMRPGDQLVAGLVGFDDTASTASSTAPAAAFGGMSSDLPAAADRLRAVLRPVRARRCASLVVARPPGGEPRMNDFPWLTLLIAGAARRWRWSPALLPAAPRRRAAQAGRARASRCSRWSSPSRSRSGSTPARRLPVHRDPRRGSALRRALRARASTASALTLVLLTAILTPVVILASLERRRRRPLGRQRLLRLDAGARGPRARVFSRHRRVPVLRAVRGDADPDLLPDRRLRRRAPLLRRGEVPALHRSFGGLLMLASVVGLYVVSADAGQPDVPALRAGQLDIGTTTGRWLFLGFFVAFAIKAPMVPVHTWLPDAAGRPRPAPRCCWSASSTRSAPSG